MKVKNKVSSKPRRQRKILYSNNWKVRHRNLGAALSPSLREKLNVRSCSVRRGDQVKVMRGQEGFEGVVGRVISVDYRRGRITVEKVQRRRTDGSNLPYPIHPSNVQIVKLAKDRWRTGKEGILNRRGREEEVEIEEDFLTEAPELKASELSYEDDEEGVDLESDTEDDEVDFVEVEDDDDEVDFVEVEDDDDEVTVAEIADENDDDSGSEVLELDDESPEDQEGSE